MRILGLLLILILPFDGLFAQGCQNQFRLIEGVYYLNASEYYRQKQREVYIRDLEKYNSFPELQPERDWNELWGRTIHLKFDQPKTFEWALTVMKDREKLYVEGKQVPSRFADAYMYYDKPREIVHRRCVIGFADGSTYTYDEPFYTQYLIIPSFIIVVDGSMPVLVLDKKGKPKKKMKNMPGDRVLLNKLLSTPVKGIDVYYAYDPRLEGVEIKPRNLELKYTRHSSLQLSDDEAKRLIQSLQCGLKEAVQ
jgi:hypothetical protein